MNNAFDKQSFVVQVDAPYIPFELSFVIVPGVFLEDYPLVQKYIHEMLHFWQTLGSGYLMNMTLTEWVKLKKYEKDGTIEDATDLMERFTKPDPDVGFSAWDLTESLCRYWELHILNPAQLELIKNGIPLPYDKEEYHKAGLEEISKLPSSHPFRRYSPVIVAKIMRGFSPEHDMYSSKSFYELMRDHIQEQDNYFYPYMLVEKTFGNILSTVLFPVIGYFALQSKYPIMFFKEIIGHLSERYKEIKKEKIIINKFWRENFNEIHQNCIQLMFQLYGGALTPGWDVIVARQFNDHPVCSFYRFLFSYTRQVIGQMGLNLDMFFALPGDPNCRHLLASSFRPPATLLNGGFWTVEDVSEFNPLLEFNDIYGQAFAMQNLFQDTFQQTNMKTIKNKEDLATSAIDILERVKAFREAITLRKFN